MNPLDGVSLDLALGVALAVVLTRFVSMLRVTWGMPHLQTEVLRLVQDESQNARARLRQLSYTSPFAEAALALLDRDSEHPDRHKLLKQAEALSRKEALLSARRGQNLDVFGLLLLAAGLISAPSQWAGQPVTLLLGAGTLLGLLLTLITRRILLSRLSVALSQLQTALAERPSLSPEEATCPLCGEPELAPCSIIVSGEEEAGVRPALRCGACLGIVSFGSDPDPGRDDLSSPDASAPEASTPGLF